jgi:peptidoglycan-associated lipoprotein
MKFSTILAVAAVAFAMVTTGCRYDNVGGEGDDAALNGAGVSDLGSDVDDVDVAGQSGSLDAIAEGGRFEDLYTRCTDVSFAPVYFGFDSTVVPQGELGKIDAVAQHLTDNGNRVVVVEGNCDDRGSNEYNLVLGENRAIIIRNYLVQSGIGAERIQTRSYGEERPVAEGQGEAFWSQNRRGDFVIFQK